MLALTRTTREGDRRVCLTLPDGRRCWVVLLRAEPGKARLGFDCPADILISREELLTGDGDAAKPA